MTGTTCGPFLGAEGSQLASQRQGIVRHVEQSLRPLWPFLNDEKVSEILINGFDQLFVERGGRLYPEASPFSGEHELEALVCALSQVLGRGFGAGAPIFEGRLPDGSRVQAMHSSLCDRGCSLAIRRHRSLNLSLENWEEQGAIQAEHSVLLRAAVDKKENILVSGGTGSGKTSFLATLALLFSKDERVVVLEDSRELKLHLEHSLCLETNPQVTLAELFSASLRLRPDRIIIGEIRGVEAMSLVHAMTSGHGGCLSTIHASSPQDALRRLSTLALGAQPNLPHGALQEQVDSAIDWVVQVARGRDGKRRVTQVERTRGSRALESSGEKGAS